MHQHTSASPVLAACGLYKHFGTVAAVRGVSFAVHAGECFGLLGPNGAGKTTTIELLEGILPASSGRAEYHGEALGERFKREAGIQFQQTALQDYLTVREHLRLFARFYEAPEAIETVLQRCALTDFADRDARKLSGGQRQRLLLGIALINNPRLLFLDEPTTGLDPQARRAFWSLIRSIKSEGRTVLMTTHYMEEAYQLCDRVAIMDHGRIIAEGTPADLLAEHFGGSVVSLPAHAVVDSAHEWRINGERAECTTRDVATTLETLRGQGVPLDHLQVREHTLEDLFLALTGEALRA